MTSMYIYTVCSPAGSGKTHSTHQFIKQERRACKTGGGNITGSPNLSKKMFSGGYPENIRPSHSIAYENSRQIQSVH